MKGTTVAVVAVGGVLLVVGYLAYQRASSEIAATRESIDRAQREVAGARRDAEPITRFVEGVENILRRFGV